MRAKVLFLCLLSLVCFSVFKKSLKEINTAQEPSEKKYTPVNDVDRERYSAQGSAEEAFLKFVEILERHIDDPTLELYAEGTRIMFKGGPANTYKSDTFLEAIKDGYPYEIIVEGSRAVIKFREEAKRSWPLFFRRSSAGWRYDMATNWRVIYFDKDNHWYLKSRDHEFMFAFGAKSKHYDYRDSSFRIMRERKRTLKKEISHYQNKIDNDPNDYLAYMQLAELYFDDCWLYEDALILYEEGVRRIDSAEKKAYMHFYLGSRYMYCLQYALAIEHYKKYAEFRPKDYYGYSRIGYCYLQMKKGKEAMQYYGKSLKYQRAGSNKDAVSKIGYAAALIEDFSEAERHLRWYKQLGADAASISKLESFIKTQKNKK